MPRDKKKNKKQSKASTPLCLAGQSESNDSDGRGIKVLKFLYGFSAPSCFSFFLEVARDSEMMEGKTWWKKIGGMRWIFMSFYKRRKSRGNHQPPAEWR